ncbi:MAG: hypothetical protein JNL53_19825 [Cyclobacteriaceae bacterium]|nr:hypothetical protein [Cyclobacteriaceae bacterium]
MQRKINNWYRFYKDEDWIKSNTESRTEFDYSKVSSLELFTGTHPAVIQNRIKRKNWKFDHDISKRNYTLKEKIKRLISNILGFRVGEYKNYKIH